jgi:NCS2 family nucleobase:cation symporter-2
LLQVLPRGPIGSGYLCPAGGTAIYLGPALAAIKLGGLPLVFGMTIFAGAVEAGLSFILQRIRPLLPPEIGGLVIFFVGTTLAVVGFEYVIGSESQQPIAWSHWSVVGVTLGVTVALNVWAAGPARMFCALIGIVAGYVTAVATGLLGAQDFRIITELPLIAVPTLHHLSWDFSAVMVPPFVIAALAATVRMIGVITVCERVDDAGWVRSDMSVASRGVLADGLGSVVGGLLGTQGVSPSASSTSIIAATGVSSRVIGIALGALMIGLAFFPVVTGVFIVMPRAIMGAALLFSSAFLLINALQTITSRMLDSRRTLVIGLAMSSGVAAEVIPNFAASMPAALHSIASSSLVLGTIAALLLNGLFRIGHRKRVSLSLEPVVADLRKVEEFFTERGRRWGARPDVIARVAFGVNQAIEVIADHCEPKGALVVDAQFDEFNLDVQMTYQGMPLELPDHRPSDKEIIESEHGVLRLAGFLVRRNADRVRTGGKDGKTVLEFHFEH